MQDETTKGAVATDDKSHDADKPALTPFQTRFNEALEGWKKEGCSVVLDAGTDKERFCGAKPHGVKIEPADADGNVIMAVDCAERHARVWTFKVPEVEMKTELARQKEAAKTAARDPLKASVSITLDLRTQEVSIEPWVPTPGVGLQLAAMLTAHFQREFMAGHLAAEKAGKIVTPPAGIINPKTGKPFVS